MPREWMVWVVQQNEAGGVRLILRAKNRLTGKIVSKTAVATTRKAAQREAAALEAQMNSVGHFGKAPKFSEAVEMFRGEYLVSRRPATAARFETAANAFLRLVGDPRMDSINERMVGDFSRQYGKTVKQSTVGCALRHLATFLKWCHRQRLLSKLPFIEMPRNVAQPKNRPITLEEFERVLSAVEKVRPSDAQPWQYLLRGLWLSGMRLGEALGASWDESAAVAITAIETERPRLRIDGTAQKSGKTTESPCTPDFAALLAETPDSDRRGRVFKVPTRRVDTASGVIVKCFRAAGVRGGAHDLRRAFCTRWARRLSAQALKELARHSSLSTTLRYYVADVGLEDQIWGAEGKNEGKKPPHAPGGEVRKILKN